MKGSGFKGAAAGAPACSGVPRGQSQHHPRDPRLPAHSHIASPPPLSAERPRPLRGAGGRQPQSQSLPPNEIRTGRSDRLAKSVLSADLEQPWHCNQGRLRPAPGLRAKPRWANMAGAASATSRGGGAGRPRQGTEGESAGPGGVEWG